MRLLLPGCVLVVAACVGGCNSNETPTAPTPSNNTVIYGVIGASDSIGVGGSVPCVPFDASCPTGTGYVYVVKRRFEADGATVQLFNRGVPAAVLSQAIVTLARDIGRTDLLATFIDQMPQFISASATHISIFAGGNDANVIGENVRLGRGGADPRGFIDQQVRQFGVDLVDLVSRLRARAPNARIVAMNLPNLGAAPYVSSRPTAERSILQSIAVGLSDRVNALSAQNVTVVDLMCEGRLYTAANFSTDGFHPSDSGYALIADLLYPALRNGTTPTPSSSCPQRTLLPVF